MARNEEKAQSMLNRYITLKNEEKKKPKERRPLVGAAKQILHEEEEEVVEEERQRERESKEKSEKEMEFVAHVPLPDDKEIEKMVLEKKKKDLLSKYASQELLQDQTEAKQMLNIKR